MFGCVVRVHLASDLLRDPRAKTGYSPESSLSYYQELRIALGSLLSVSDRATHGGIFDLGIRQGVSQEIRETGRSRDRRQGQ